jgi:rRNA maturation endonuclease Nob1
VSNFARKTGDYAALSKTDLKLIALACMLDTEVSGVSKLPKEDPKPSTGAPVTNNNNPIQQPAKVVARPVQSSCKYIPISPHFVNIL